MSDFMLSFSPYLHVEASFPCWDNIERARRLGFNLFPASFYPHGPQLRGEKATTGNEERVTQAMVDSDRISSLSFRWTVQSLLARIFQSISPESREENLSFQTCLFRGEEVLEFLVTPVHSPVGTNAPALEILFRSGPSRVSLETRGLILKSSPVVELAGQELPWGRAGGEAAPFPVPRAVAGARSLSRRRLWALRQVLPGWAGHAGVGLSWCERPQRDR